MVLKEDIEKKIKRRLLVTFSSKPQKNEKTVYLVNKLPSIITSYCPL